MKVQWKGQETIISRNPLFAEQIFHDPAFHGRFGTDYGLSKLGMLNQGLIWNNSVESWHFARKECFLKSLKPHNIHRSATTAAEWIETSLNSALAPGSTQYSTTCVVYMSVYECVSMCGVWIQF